MTVNSTFKQMIVTVTHFSLALHKYFCEIGCADVKDGPRIG